MTITRETKVGTAADGETVVSEVTSPFDLTGWTLSELAKERARLEFKLESAGHQPANVVDRIAAINAEIDSRS